MDSELVALLAVMTGTIGGVVCMLAVAFVPLIGMLGLPFIYRSTWLGYTADKTVPEAYEAVSVGATTGIIQLRPASYLYTDDFPVPGAPSEVRDRLVEHYTTFLTSVILEDDHGLVANVRIPAELGPGWIMVFKLSPHDDGTRVQVRARSTFCIPFPVITFFLALQHNLHLRRIVRRVAAA